jgi:predicted phosphodiesterase
LTFHDIGTLQGPLIIFGGSYSNLQATRALRKQADALGFKPSNIICTGDTVAYCAHPNETVELLRDWGIHVLMGNCEESLGWNAGDCGCGFEEGTACDTLANQWFRFADSALNQSHREWMRLLPRRLKFVFQGRQFIVVHGGTEKINEFVFASSSNTQKLAAMTSEDVDGVVAGHSGLPFTQIIKNRLWHNAGVIGMPANDGTPRTWYSRWNIEDEQIRIEHCALNYDYNQARDGMLNADLNNGYADGLLTGLWPSMDVLPAVEKAEQGRSLAETTVVF